MIAYEQTSAAGETKGDLILGARASTSGATAATKLLKIRSDGVVEVLAGDLIVRGESTFDKDFDLTKNVAAVKHSGTTGLEISSVSGYVTIASTSSYVDVESVRFTANAIGLSGTPNIISLASAGVTVTGSLAVSGALTMTDLTLSGDLVMSKTAATFTHTAAAGATSGLTISSDNGFVVITGGTSTASYVDVEDVRFTSKDIGISGTATLISLASTGVSVTGTLQSSGKATLADDLAVTGAKSNLTALGLSGDLFMSDTVAELTHTAAAGATSGLTISSDNGFVEVESVRITGGASKSDIGFGATAIIALSATGVGVTGTVSSTGDLTVGSSKFVVTATSGDRSQAGDTSLSKTAAAITHTAAAGATSGLTISSDNGFVEVESVRITGGASKSDIGYGATAIIALSATGVGVTGTV